MFTFKLPERLDPSRAFQLAKKTLDGRDVKFVKQQVEFDPYTAEAWFYGRTKIKQEEIVIRIGVDSKAGLFYLVADTSRSNVLAGLLAELGHDLSVLTAREGMSLIAEKDRLVKLEYEQYQGLYPDNLSISSRAQNFDM